MGRKSTGQIGDPEVVGVLKNPANEDHDGSSRSSEAGASLTGGTERLEYRMTPRMNPDYDAESVDELRDDIDKTRADLSGTVKAIKERIEPHRVAMEAKEAIRRTVNVKTDEARTAAISALDVVNEKADRARFAALDAMEKVGDMADKASKSMRRAADRTFAKAKENPYPAILIGVGVAAGFVMISRARARKGEIRAFRGDPKCE